MEAGDVLLSQASRIKQNERWQTGGQRKPG